MQKKARDYRQAVNLLILFYDYKIHMYLTEK